MVDIKRSLINNSLKFNEIVFTIKCRKWEKWVVNNETPFPCVCLTRNKDCVFAETYYELCKCIKLLDYIPNCEEVLLDYYSLVARGNNLEDWLEINRGLFEKVNKFTGMLSIKTSVEPYIKKEISYAIPKIILDFQEKYNL